MSACKGMNCGCTDGVSHSVECRAEYAAVISQVSARAECVACEGKPQAPNLPCALCGGTVTATHARGGSEC